MNNQTPILSKKARIILAIVILLGGIGFFGGVMWKALYNIQQAEQRTEADFTTIDITVQQIREYTTEENGRIIEKNITIQPQNEDFELLMPSIFGRGIIDEIFNQIHKRDELTIKVLKQEIELLKSNRYFYLLQNGRRDEIAVFGIEKNGEIIYKADIHEMNPNDKPIQNAVTLLGIGILLIVVFGIIRAIILGIYNKLKGEKIN